MKPERVIREIRVNRGWVHVGFRDDPLLLRSGPRPCGSVDSIIDTYGPERFHGAKPLSNQSTKSDQLGRLSAKDRAFVPNLLRQA